MKKYLLGLSAVALVVGHAQAADVVRNVEPPVVAAIDTTPVFSWDGAYIGAQIGGAWAKTDVDGFYQNTVTPADNFQFLDWSADPNGFVGGLYAGYNFDIGEPSGFVIGLETDFVWGDVDAKQSYRFNLDALGFPNDDLVARTHVKQEWAGATRVKFAYAVDRWLPYVSAGVAYAKVKSGASGWVEDSATGVIDPDTITSISNSNTLTGWTLGVGTDYAITDNILLRVEYRYADYGNKTYRYSLSDLTGDDNDFAGYKLDHKSHDLRLGVAYKF